MEVFAALQYAATSHCQVEDWHDGDELKPKTKRKVYVCGQQMQRLASSRMVQRAGRHLLHGLLECAATTCDNQMDKQSANYAHNLAQTCASTHIQARTHAHGRMTCVSCRTQQKNRKRKLEVQVQVQIQVQEEVQVQIQIQVGRTNARNM